MTLAAEPEAPPLREDPDGSVRVGSTRVLLELVIRAFEDGATPETIVQRYDALGLRDVYAVIAYYLGHREDVQRYLTVREQKAAELRTRLESPPQELAAIRERLHAARLTAR